MRVLSFQTNCVFSQKKEEDWLLFKIRGKDFDSEGIYFHTGKNQYIVFQMGKIILYIYRVSHSIPEKVILL